ncbi:uncharacterized protein LOC135398998 isoform X2 [Ornithodoros turicata]|uniref:uncharacterized protein LOC135398998 isoform X2 n=1 Tax=Ornithodoros turicata TaxID=34597 RepID=UPI0031393125
MPPVIPTQSFHTAKGNNSKSTHSKSRRGFWCCRQGEMCCDNRCSISIYAIIGCLQGAGNVAFRLIYNTGQHGVVKYVDITFQAISLVMHMILLLAMIQVSKKLLGIFITYLRLCVAAMLILIVIDITVGIYADTGSQSTKGDGARMGQETSLPGVTDVVGFPDEYPFLKHFDASRVRHDVSLTNETTQPVPEIEKRAETPKPGERKKYEQPVEIFGIKYTFVNHVITIMVYLFVAWRMDTYYATLPGDG